MPQPTPLNATIPAAYGLSLLSLMAQRGHPDADILAGSSLTRAHLQAEQGQIDGRQYMVMLHNALRLDGNKGLAYELGLRSQVTKHGFVGFGLISCANLREAIDFSARYLQSRVSTFTSRMAVKGGQVVIELESLVPLGPLRNLIMDMVIVELCTLFAKVLGSDTASSGWSSEIWVPYPEPDCYAPYRDRLPPFHFNAATPTVQIRFPARMLDEPIPSADPVSVRLAIDRCEHELASRTASLTTADHVLKHLVCASGRYPDMAAVAGLLHVSERTLKRRLQEENTNFQALLDKVRRQDSMRLLGNAGLAIKQVAEAVGYADPANFARAFTKWTGLSPREWRRQQQPAGPN